MITVKRFTAPWCAPCRMLAPVLKQLETELPDVKFEIVDVDEDPVQAEEFGIRTIPTVLIIRDEQILNTIVGANPKKRYVDAILAVS